RLTFAGAGTSYKATGAILYAYSAVLFTANDQPQADISVAVVAIQLQQPGPLAVVARQLHTPALLAEFGTSARIIPLQARGAVPPRFATQPVTQTSNRHRTAQHELNQRIGMRCPFLLTIAASHDRLARRHLDASQGASQWIGKVQYQCATVVVPC